MVGTLLAAPDVRAQKPADITEAQLTAVQNESQPKRKEADAAAARGDEERAGDIEEANAENMITVVMVRVAQQDMRLGIIAMMTAGDCHLRAALHYSKAQKFSKAADALDKGIAIHAKLGKMSPHESDLADFRKQSSEWRARGSGSPSQPTPSAPPSPPPSVGALQEIQRGIKLSEDGKPSEALAIFDKAFPTLDGMRGNTAAIVKANMDGGRIYAQANMRQRAEGRYLQAIKTVEAASGSSDAALIEPLLALGNHLVQDETERAAPFYMRAYDIATATKSDQLPQTIMGLAMVLEERKDYRQAIALMIAGRKILAENIKEATDVFRYLVSNTQLASMYEELAEWDNAWDLLEEVRVKFEPYYRQQPDALGLMWAVYQRSVGDYWRKKGDYKKAQVSLKEAYDIFAKSFPRDSLIVAGAECNLGESYWADGDLDRSLGPIGHCFDLEERAMVQMLASGTEEQKRAYVGAYIIAYEKTMTAQIRARPPNPRMNRLAMTQVLRTKGRVLDAVAGESALIRRHADDATRALLDKLGATRATLASVSTGRGKPEEIKTLEAEVRSLESRISEKSSTFRRATKEVSLETVRAAIPPGGVLVDIVAFRPLDAHYHTLSDQEPQRYVAFVLHGDGSDPVAIDLGPSEPIDRTVVQLRTAVSNPKADPMAPGKTLYDQVMAPLEPHLKGKTNIILSPDGALNTVPFAAMRKDDAYLIDRYTFTYVTSGRDLLRWGDGGEQGRGVVVVANPDFAMNGKSAPSGSAFARVRFPALPGTESEAKAIKGLFPSAKTLTGKDATESEIKRLRQPRVLHVATHGFFLGQKGAAPQTRALELDDAEKTEVKEAQDPLLRSGLALAGASSLNGNSSEDGILTALESASLDLAGTKLVVLSACQTATGEARNGEGVYGLRRAITMAGAETLVMSLWSVDDEATNYLMQGFYRRLKAGAGRSESLREVQLEMARSKGVSHPYYWAAFIPSGDPGQLKLEDETYSGNPSPISVPTSPKPADKPTPSKDDDDEDVRIEPQTLAFAGAHYMNLTHLRSQVDRVAILGSLSMQTPFLSRFIGHGTVGLHDALTGAFYFGGRTSDTTHYPGGDELSDESSFAYGLRGAYELAPGIRTHGIGFYAGAMVEYASFALGDARTYGTSLPLLAMFQFSLGGVPIGLRGTYGKWIVDTEVMSGGITFAFSAFDLRLGFERFKMDSSISLDGADARASAGQQASLLGTLAIGGSL